MTHNILYVLLDEFVHGSFDISDRVSFNEVRTIARVFFRLNGTTADDLIEIYNSENREYLTNIPCLKMMLKDCTNEWGGAGAH